MKKIQLLAVLTLSAMALSACTTTSSQTKSAGNSDQSNQSTVASTGATRLGDLFDHSSSIGEENSSLPKVDVGAVVADNKIRVQMKPELGREFHLCETTDKCTQVIPITTETNSNVNQRMGNEEQIADNFIGDVRLSDQTQKLLGAKLPELADSDRIVIMDPDIELNLLTAGGLQEPNALWSSAAKGYVTEITAQYFQKLGHKVTLYKDGANNIDSKTGRDLINLHEAVGQSIFMYQYDGLFQLPTKKNGDFNWKLGKTAKQIKDGYGADLGLFVYMRDSYSSGSRVAAQFMMAALFGAHIPGGQQVGFVSLVDMETGDVIWFNKLFSTTGDLRTFGAAFSATDALLKDIPL